MRPREHKGVVGAVLDHAGAGIPEKLLHRILAAYAVAAEQLDGVTGDFEGRLGAKDLRRNGVFDAWRRIVVVVYHGGTRQRTGGLDFGKHVEQLVLNIDVCLYREVYTVLMLFSDN